MATGQRIRDFSGAVPGFGDVVSGRMEAIAFAGPTRSCLSNM